MTDSMKGFRKAAAAAFPHTIPVLVCYLFMGIAAGLMLIHPGTLTDIIGIGVLVVVLVFQIITGKGSKAVKAA